MTPKLGDRALFPDLQGQAYFNHASCSPPPLPAVKAVQDTLHRYAQVGLGAIPEAMAGREHLRGKLGRLVGADASEIAFVPNTTAGVQQIALNMPWRPGDVIVVFEGEFPTNVTPWQQVAKRYDLTIRVASVEALATGNLDETARLLEGARLVAMSAVQFHTGFRMPIAEIASLAHDRGCLVFVDGIQAVGAMNLPWQDIDFLSCGGHKWLMGLEGAGFVMVRQEHKDLLEPMTAGWLSHTDPMSFLLRGPGHHTMGRPLKSAPAFMEAGVMNALGYVALDASVDLLLCLGVDNIFQHVSGVVDDLEARLLERDFTSLRVKGHGSQILSVLPPAGQDVVDLQHRLSEAGFGCAVPDGKLRFSPHWPNDHDQVRAMIAAIDSLV